MRRSRFTEEQIIGVLKEHQAGLSAAALAGQPCRLLRLGSGNAVQATATA